MKTKWLIILCVSLCFALVTACDNPSITSVSLQQLSEEQIWHYEMDCDDVIAVKSETSSQGQTNWLFESQNAGEVTVCFTCCEDSDCAPYMTYTYRVDEAGAITTVGVVGSATKTSSTAKCFFQALAG